LWLRAIAQPWSALALVAIGLAGGLALNPTPIASALSPNCTIRGNVSMKTGERIYHLPGQKFYAEANIKPWRGERWFCSEEEARQAGWRRAKV
jgi:hypothetical protein